MYSDMATRLSRKGTRSNARHCHGRCRIDRGSPPRSALGPIALAGLGGIHAELLEDVGVALAPVGESQAAALLRSLRGAPLLKARGAARARRRGSCTCSRGALVGGRPVPGNRRVEINPLLVTAGGAVGLDARIILSGP